MFSRCFSDFSVGVGAFVIGLSQISFFFSSCKVLLIVIDYIDIRKRNVDFV